MRNHVLAVAILIGCAATPAQAAPSTSGVRPNVSAPSVRALSPRRKLARAETHNALPAPIDRVVAANRAALREPAAQAYMDAVQLYAFSPGALYRLYAAPGKVSDIALQPGEKLVSVAAGDTARWVIGDTVSGSGSGQRTHILVKPAAAALDTNLVIATDRRMYHVQVKSNLHAAMFSIAWTYPDEQLLALRPPALALVDEGTVFAPDRLDFGYRIEGDHPAWRPLRAFDDGQQVFIEFPPGLIAAEAPPLLLATPDGVGALVNYRVRGRFYIVDRLFSVAELRLGKGRQQRVRIVRLPEAKRAERKSS